MVTNLSPLQNPSKNYTNLRCETALSNATKWCDKGVCREMTLDPQCFLPDGTFLSGTPCDDGDSNTFWDSCAVNELACAGFQVDPACLDSDGPVEANADCDDGDNTTSKDVCNFRIGRKFTCEGVGAQDDELDPLYSMCQDSEGNALPDGTSCDDGHKFTHLNECRSGYCLWHYLDPQCVTDNHEFVPNAPCDDGKPKTFFDICVIDAATGDRVCAGLEIDEECKDESGMPVPRGTPCNDGNPKTIGDVCMSVIPKRGTVSGSGQRLQCTGQLVESTCYDFIADQFLPPGTPCKHKNEDVVVAKCDGYGVCDGLIVDPACRTNDKSSPSYPMVAELTPCDDGKNRTVDDVCILDFFNPKGKIMSCEGCDTTKEICNTDNIADSCGSNMVSFTEWTPEDPAAWDNMVNGTGVIINDKMNVRSQTVDLTKFHDADFLDTSPEIFIEVDVAGASNESHVYFLRADLLDKDQNIIYSFSEGTPANPLTFKAHLYEARTLPDFDNDIMEFMDYDDYAYEDTFGTDKGLLLLRKKLTRYPKGARYLKITQGGKGMSKGPVFETTYADINGCCHQHPLACGVNGLCTDKQDGFSCACMPPYMGKTCELLSACHKQDGSSQCVHGICTQSNADYTCTCESGWSGRNCDQDINECQEPYTCGPAGTCVNYEGSYECLCPPGFKGLTCALEDWTMGQTRHGDFAFQDNGEDRFVVKVDGGVWADGSLLGDFKYISDTNGGKCKAAVSGRASEHKIGDWTICESDTGNLLFSKNSRQIMFIQPDGRMYSDAIKAYYKQGSQASLEPGRCDARYTKSFPLWQICITTRNYIGFFLHQMPVVLVHHQSPVWSAYGGGAYFMRNSMSLPAGAMLQMLPWDTNNCEGQSANLVEDRFLSEKPAEERESGGWEKVGDDRCSWLRFGQFTSPGSRFCSRNQLIDLASKVDLSGTPSIFVQEDVYAHSLQRSSVTHSPDSYYVQFELLDKDQKTVATWGRGNATNTAKLGAFQAHHNNHDHVYYEFKGPHVMCIIVSPSFRPIEFARIAKSMYRDICLPCYIFRL